MGGWGGGGGREGRDGGGKEGEVESVDHPTDDDRAATASALSLNLLRVSAGAGVESLREMGRFDFPVGDGLGLAAFPTTMLLI